MNTMSIKNLFFYHSKCSKMFLLVLDVKHIEFLPD